MTILSSAALARGFGVLGLALTLCGTTLSEQLPPAWPGAPLPATFTGVVACADCAGVVQTLTLRADGLYRLRRTHLGKPTAPVNELGRWRLLGQGRQPLRVQLQSGQDLSLLALRGDDTLRWLDREGRPIGGGAPLELRRTERVDPVTDLARWHGELRYQADAASFTDCNTGLRWPVAIASDFVSAERAYSAARLVPGAAMMVEFEGRLQPPTGKGEEGEDGQRERLLIDRFGSVLPGSGCESGTKAEATA
jgi:uncharacterized lipoprotein NlpE involved in copper resistance